MTVPEKLAALREQMAQNGMDYYVIFSQDYHESEYVGGYFKGRAWMSGFTGSAGTLVVAAKEARLWTDGRYFLQAADQLEGSGITLMKMGEPGVPTIQGYFKEVLGENETVGFDGRCASINFARNLGEIAEAAGAKISYETDLLEKIWADRPALSAEPVFELADCYTGENRSSKLARIRGMLEGGYLVISSLDDIAWLLNLRGNDVAYNPVFLSYMILGKQNAVLFVNETILSDEIKADLAADGIEIRPYDEVFEAVKALPADSAIEMDPDRSSYAMYQSVPGSANLICRANVTQLQKAIKNPTEAKNMRIAHVKDGVAVTRFMYWLKHNLGKVPMTELSAAAKQLEFREEQEAFIEESFAPIVSYGAHGAIVHYSATEESDIPVEQKGFLLCDTGAQFPEGTTDITRTYVCGELTAEQKMMYTAVLRANLNLASAKFKYGCNGLNFDYLARKPFWDMGMDYNHGTGHGVGYLLNVHEGPNGFRYREVPGKHESAPFEVGMVTTDEPGIYLTDKYGIRLENCMICEEAETTEYGRFLKFAPLTMVPFDREAIEPALMSDEELRLLNAYHAEVCETIAPLLPAEEAEWLKGVTAPITK